MCCLDVWVRACLRSVVGFYPCDVVIQLGCVHTCVFVFLYSICGRVYYVRVYM